MKNEMAGVVVELKGAIAMVKLSNHVECAECGSCLGDNALTLEALNPLGAAVGDKVVVVVEGGGLALAAFVVYAMPLLAVAAGAVLGHYVSLLTRHGEIAMQVIFGLLFFGLSLAYVRRFDKALKAKQGMPVIARTAEG